MIIVNKSVEVDLRLDELISPGDLAVFLDIDDFSANELINGVTPFEADEFEKLMGLFPLINQPA